MTAQTDIELHVVDDAKEAMQKGHFYRPPVFLPIKIDRAVVVRNGTASGKSTVDLVLEDEKGQKYVVMTTTSLLATIVAIGTKA